MKMQPLLKKDKNRSYLKIFLSEMCHNLYWILRGGRLIFLAQKLVSTLSCVLGKKQWFI